MAILTATRTGELQIARWREMLAATSVNLWTIPEGSDENATRGPRRSHSPFQRPLSDGAISILEGLKGDGELDLNELIFWAAARTHGLAKNALIKTARQDRSAHQSGHDNSWVQIDFHRLGFR